jgi:hypothetical protein
MKSFQDFPAPRPFLASNATLLVWNASGLAGDTAFLVRSVVELT